MTVCRYEFGCFRLEPSERRLVRDNIAVPVAPKAFEILVALIESHGHLITREALMQAVWPDSFVEETNLTVNISLLRKILGNTPDGQPWIVTVPKCGYRFDGPVAVLLDSSNNEVHTGTTLPPDNLSSSTAGLPSIEVHPESPVPGASAVTARRPSSRFLVAAAALAAVFLVIWTGFRLYRSRGVHSAASSVQSIAVLPFEAPGASGENQYLGMGLTDAVITRLGRLSQIVVRPISAVRTLGSATDPIKVGRELNVQAVLQGSVQRIGDHTRVAVRLRRASDGNDLWAQQFDEKTESDFEIEDTISQQLANALALHLSPGEQRQLSTQATPNSQAHDLYIQGRYYWNKRSVESVQKSIDLFRQATSLDPNYAAAWSGLSDALILAGSYGNGFLSPGEAMPMAKSAALKALAIDDSSAEAHTSLAYISLMWDWDFARAESEFKRAIEISPGYVNAHHWYSHELAALGRLSESHEESEMALGLDPTDVVINEHMAWHHMMAREYDRSIPQALKAVQLDPSFVQAHRVLALDYLYSGRNQEACAEFETGVKLSHDDPVANAYLARCYALTHREAEARRILSQLEKASAERYTSAAEIAAVYSALNSSDSALKWLDRACDERAGSLIYLNIDRVWDPLRSNPRFLAVVKRVNLPPLADEAAAR